MSFVSDGGWTSKWVNFVICIINIWKTFTSTVNSAKCLSNWRLFNEILQSVNLDVETLLFGWTYQKKKLYCLDGGIGLGNTHRHLEPCFVMFNVYSVEEM